MICKDGVEIKRGERCPACGAQSWEKCRRREYALAAAQADPSKAISTAYNDRDHRDE